MRLDVDDRVMDAAFTAEMKKAKAALPAPDNLILPPVGTSKQPEVVHPTSNHGDNGTPM